MTYPIINYFNLYLSILHSNQFPSPNFTLIVIVCHENTTLSPSTRISGQEHYSHSIKFWKHNYSYPCWFPFPQSKCLHEESPDTTLAHVRSRKVLLIFTVHITKTFTKLNFLLEQVIHSLNLFSKGFCICLKFSFPLGQFLSTWLHPTDNHRPCKFHNPSPNLMILHLSYFSHLSTQPTIEFYNYLKEFHLQMHQILVIHK